MSEKPFVTQDETTEFIGVLPTSNSRIQRYAHLSPGHLAEYADNARLGTNLVQQIKKA